MGGVAWLMTQVDRRLGTGRKSPTRSLRRASGMLGSTQVAARITKPGFPVAMTASSALLATGVQPVVGKWVFSGGVALAAAYEATATRAARNLRQLAQHHLAIGEPDIAFLLSESRIQVLAATPAARTRHAVEHLRRVIYGAAMLGDLYADSEDELGESKIRLGEKRHEGAVDAAEECLQHLTDHQWARVHREVWRLDGAIEALEDQRARFIARESMLEIFRDRPFPSYSQYAFDLAREYVDAAHEIHSRGAPDPTGVATDSSAFSSRELEEMAELFEGIDEEYALEQELEAEVIFGSALDDDSDEGVWFEVDDDYAEADAYLEYAEDHIAVGLAVLGEQANASAVDATVRMLLELDELPVEVVLTAYELALQMTDDDRAHEFSEILADDDDAFTNTLAFLGLDLNPPEQALGM